MFLTDIYDERKRALKKDGENSVGNKIFKQFRRLGYIRLLKDKKAELEAKEMSLESLQEAVEDETELFWHLRDGIVDNEGAFLNKTDYSEDAKEVLTNLKGNLTLENSKIVDISPDKGFAVSPEQFSHHLLTKEQLEKFKEAVKGEKIMLL